MVTATAIFAGIQEQKQKDAETAFPEYKKLLLAMAKDSKSIDLSEVGQLITEQGITEEQLASDVDTMRRRLKAVEDLKLGKKSAEESKALQQKLDTMQAAFLKEKQTYQDECKAINSQLIELSRNESAAATASHYLTDKKNLLDPRIVRELEELNQQRLSVVERMRQKETQIRFVTDSIDKLPSPDADVSPSSAERSNRERKRLKELLTQHQTELRELEQGEYAQIDANGAKIREKMLKTA